MARLVRVIHVFAALVKTWITRMKRVMTFKG
jgi:hypothetical protein